MTLERLTSRHNPLLKIIRLISSGARRAPRNLVVAEGVRVLEEVHQCGCSLEAVVLSEDFGNSPREEALLRSWVSQGVRVCRADSRLFPTISDLETPQGAIALVRIPEFCIEEQSLAQDALLLFACGIQDPGNLGTLIRTAAAAGASMVCTSKGTVSARNPKSIRASAGAFFRIPVVERMEISDFVDYCQQHEVRIYRTDVRSGLPHTEIDFSKSSALLLGNEGQGIPRDLLKDIPAVHIQMAQGIESLNVATAGAILIFEASRQRMR